MGQLPPIKLNIKIIKFKQKRQDNNWNPMQNFSYQSNPVATAPASSKALIKLKTDKLIPTAEVRHQAGLLGNYPPQPIKPQIVFNGPQPNLINHTYSSPAITLPRQNSNTFAGSGSSTFNQSDLAQSNANSFSTQHQQSQFQISGSTVGFNQNNSTTGFGLSRNQPLKPLSAFLKSNHLSTNGDASRVRSNSASQFSFNQQYDRRVSHLQAKLGDYTQQILRSNRRLSEKEKRVTELESQLYELRKKSSQYQLKLRQVQQGQPFRVKKMGQLEVDYKLAMNRQAQLSKLVEAKVEKINSLEASLDKILKSKNIQIQQLNQSCKELSKHVETLNQKHERQNTALRQNLSSQQILMKQNQIQFENLVQRMRSYQESERTHESNMGKIGQLQQIVSALKSENTTLKTDLSAHIEQLEILQKRYNMQSIQNSARKAQIEKLNDQLASVKRTGDQQIEFLSAKVEESAHEKERLLEEIELTKAINIKRNAIFERQVIYELKQENDRLWSKLIEKSDVAANVQQSNPEYWTKNSPHQSISSPLLAPSSGPVNRQQPAQKSKQDNKNEVNVLEKQYNAFIEQLEEEQENRKSRISELHLRQAKNNEEDLQFYKNKCLHLQKIVEDHLQINIGLKEQLQKVKDSNFGSNPSAAEIIFLKSELQKQQILNQTLSRSFDLFKEEYEQKFKAAQKRVEQIQNESKSQNDPNLMVIEILRREISMLEQQIRKLTIENSDLSIKISESNRWHSMYLDIKRQVQQMSPISYLKQGTVLNQSQLKDNQHMIENLRGELENLNRLYQQKQIQNEQIQQRYEQRCHSYEQQLKLKEEQFLFLRNDYDKIERQLTNQKIRYDQLLKDTWNLKDELNQQKKGSRVQKNKKELEYYLSLTKSKMLEIQGFIKQIHAKLSEGGGSKEDFNLAQNAEMKMSSCLGTFQQLEAAYRQG